MSIRNLTTENLKSDQDLNVNSINANTLFVENLSVINLDSQSITNANTIETDIIEAENIVCNFGLNFPNSPYAEQFLSVYEIYEADLEFNIYGLSSGTIVNGLKIVKLGLLCFVLISPFQISGVAGGADPVINSNTIIPEDLRPFAIAQSLSSTPIIDFGTNETAYFLYIPLAPFSFEIRKEDGSNWTSGNVNIEMNRGANFTYIANQ
jgi:hypothetical protein